MTVLASTLFVLLCVAMFLMARTNDDRKITSLKNSLGNGNRSDSARVDFAALQHLPPPVLRYFRKVLTEGQALIASAELRQRGTLRTDPHSSNWLNFSAREFIASRSRSFVWDARIRLPLGFHLRVVDAYVNGTGAGWLSFMSAFRFGSETGAPELNAGALHRYLAEAVWFPTALLPEAGVQWTALDEHSALATLADHNCRVTLVFKFNGEDEVCSVVSGGRWRRIRNGYKQERWEGHFSGYYVSNGMRVPRYGEVGWHHHGALELVWKGHVDSVLFRMTGHLGQTHSRSLN